MAKEYELLSQVDFGVLRDTDTGQPIPESEQPELHGLKEEGDTVMLEDDVAEPLLEARVIKPVGEELPLLSHDNPEELGYEGEEARDADMGKSQEEADKAPADTSPKGAQAGASGAAKSPQAPK